MGWLSIVDDSLEPPLGAQGGGATPNGSLPKTEELILQRYVPIPLLTTPNHRGQRTTSRRQSTESPRTTNGTNELLHNFQDHPRKHLKTSIRQLCLLKQYLLCKAPIAGHNCILHILLGVVSATPWLHGESPNFFFFQLKKKKKKNLIK
jgi:hypothetical protein